MIEMMLNFLNQKVFLLGKRKLNLKKLIITIDLVKLNLQDKKIQKLE